MSDNPAREGTGKTEWKVRIASLAAFVGSLAASILIETRGVELVNDLPENVRVVLLPVLVAVGTWFAGRAARSRPEYISKSTLEAIRGYIDRHGGHI